MMTKCGVFLWTLCLLSLLMFCRDIVAIRAATNIQYEHFEDYLLSLGDTDSNSATTPTPSVEEVGLLGPSTADILDYMKEVPRSHWSCCMLGRLAGEKGFHCQAHYYAARMAMRNSNRAHNRQLGFHGRDRIPGFGKALMLTLQRCVSHRHSAEFHSCCYSAAQERHAVRRWRHWKATTRSSR